LAPLERAFIHLFRGPGPLQIALDTLDTELAEDAYVAELVEFLRT
jgi:hypothetical protein